MRKLVAFLLIIAMSFAYLPAYSGAYAADYSPQLNLLKDKLDNLKDDDMDNMLYILAGMVSDDYDYSVEIEAALDQLDQGALDELEENGFIDLDDDGDWTSYEGIEKVLAAITDVVYGDYAEDGTSLNEIIEKVKAADTDIEIESAKQEVLAVYEYIMESLPAEVVDYDFSNYGETLKDKARVLLEMAKLVYTDGDTCVRADGDGGLELFLPEDYIDNANDALAELAIDKGKAMELDSDHEEAIGVFLSIISQKINSYIADPENISLVEVLTIADKLGLLEGDIPVDPPVEEDKTAPTNVTVTLASKTTSTVKLNLSAQDESGIAKYHVYRDGDKVEETTSSTWTDTGLEANKTYIYKIKAEDTKGNISGFSSELTVKTNAETAGGGGGGGGGGGVTEEPGTGGTDTNANGDKVEVSTEISKDAVKVETAGNNATVSVDAGELNKQVENLIAALKDAKVEEGQQKVGQIVIDIGDIKQDNVQLSIPVEALKKVEGANTEVVVKMGDVQVNLPLANIISQGEATTGITLEIKTVNEFSEVQKKMQDKTNGAVEKISVAKVVSFELYKTTQQGEKLKADSNFKSSVRVEIDVKELSVDPDKTVLVHVKDDGSFDVVGGKIKNSKLSAKLKHFSSYAVVERTVEIPDALSHWAKKSIGSMASKDVVRGYADGTFKPENSVTRAEFAKLVVTAMELDTESYEGGFGDLDGHWAADYVQTAKNSGIINGYADGTFKPDGEITRAEMAAMLSRAVAGKAGSVNLTQFADSHKIPAWASKGVEGAVAAELMKGDTNGKFNPEKLTTRAESATVVYRLFNK
ncbi:MAG: hypothetical protein GT589_00275 [Peptoclostridium sp.]|uniref:S-layer homology domain-containing protein n=1 Tax=Peptoclostridium sp. TaxID=1904860 RepID=UPI00139E82D6|nr:S-layer homology domain-containing protein [Peptoclostridium sp.]MZQ74579.1 hypothetical protein [Peptoclostridium sp.]